MLDMGATRIIQPPNAFPKQNGKRKCKRCNGRALAPGYNCPEFNGLGLVLRTKPRLNRAKHALGTGRTVLESPRNRSNSSLRRSSLKRCSEKRRAELELYKVMRPEFLRGKMCEFPQDPFGCSNNASQVHHRKGHGKYFLDRRTWMPTCHVHHAWIEANKKQARKMGLITYK